MKSPMKIRFIIEIIVTEKIVTEKIITEKDHQMIYIDQRLNANQNQEMVKTLSEPPTSRYEKMNDRSLGH